MKHFFVIVNAEKELACATAERLRERLLSYGDDISAELWTGPKQEYYAFPEDTDCIITVGGDGTLIQAARATVGEGIPLIGVNRGHMGYLTELSEEKELEKALLRLIKDDVIIEERMMLSAKVHRGKECIFRDIALNEAMIARYNSLHTLRFEVHVNGTMLGAYTADGIIVSTPTGSTAYSLSAGGPIAKPQANLMILTPVCSHALNARSIIFPPEDKIDLIVRSENQLVSCDGDSQELLMPGDVVTVERSMHVTKLIRLKNDSFLETLREKMAFV